MNPMPPMGKRSSSQVSMLLPSTLTVKLSPETCVLTVIADRGFPGRRCGGDNRRLRHARDHGAAAEFQFASAYRGKRATQVFVEPGGAHHPGEAARVDSREKIQIVVDQLHRRNEQGERAGAHAGDVHQPILHAAHPVVPAGSEVFFDADHGRWRGRRSRWRHGNLHAPLGAAAPGEPAIAAATVPSKVTFGQPTGSCGINAVNATCCTGRVTDGVRAMVKR